MLHSLESLPAASAFAFKEALGLTNAELASVLGVSLSTLGRMDSAKSRLNPGSSDRLMRATRLFSIATEVLESVEAAAGWLKSPQRALGGAVPLALTQTDIGSRTVEVLLERMEHGVYT